MPGLTVITTCYKEADRPVVKIGIGVPTGSKAACNRPQIGIRR
jgi:hypothetical protein